MLVDVTADGFPIEPETLVEVVDVEGSRVVVGRSALRRVQGFQKPEGREQMLLCRRPLVGFHPSGLGVSLQNPGGWVPDRGLEARPLPPDGGFGERGALIYDDIGCSLTIEVAGGSWSDIPAPSRTPEMQHGEPEATPGFARRRESGDVSPRTSTDPPPSDASPPVGNASPAAPRPLPIGRRGASADPSPRRAWERETAGATAS